MMTSNKSPTPRAIRRVVTGQDESGKSIIASHTQVAPIIAPLLPGAAFFDFWGADAMPGLPDDGAEPSYRTWFPPDGGFRFELITLPPDGTPQSIGMDQAQALAETNKVLPGLMDVMDPKHPRLALDRHHRPDLCRQRRLRVEARQR